MEQLFEELLARAQAGVDDGNLGARLLADQADHLFGQVAIFNRITHVQGEDPAALAQAAACRISWRPPGWS